ncbi:MAG: S-layer protein [Candidatus Aenigmatarchaeota archaeon]|nr:S-layer protein [Candidatus Aenigmarchaeota archaeon]
MEFLVEETGKGQKIFNTLMIKDKKALSALSSDLSFKILKELTNSPQCAIDIARKLKQHEQKIYYHIRRLEKYGFIKLERVEERVGATAKIYSLTSPSISFKIFDEDHYYSIKTKPLETKFLSPFIQDAKLNSLIIVGSPDPHGKYKASASDGYSVILLGTYFGQFINKINLPIYKLDTQVNESDLKKNLILVGGPKTNIITQKINEKLPIYFDYSEEIKDWTIISTLSKKTYREKEIGVICRIKNPFNEEREVLFLSGMGFRGTLSATIALIKHSTEIQSGNINDSKSIAKVVKGVDEDSDGIIDEVEFLE